MELKPAELVAEALDRGAERCPVLDVREVAIDSARAKEGVRPAYIRVAAPDEIVQGLRGPASKAPYDVYLVAVPRSLADGIESGLVIDRGVA